MGPSADAILLPARRLRHDQVLSTPAGSQVREAESGSRERHEGLCALMAVSLRVEAFAPSGADTFCRPSPYECLSMNQSCTTNALAMLRLAVPVVSPVRSEHSPTLMP